MFECLSVWVSEESVTVHFPVFPNDNHQSTIVNPNALAHLKTMIVITIKMHALPAKRHELLQTLHELMDVMRTEKGYLNAHVHIDADNPNTFTFIEEWATPEDVDTYVQSEYFHVLRGAMKLLTSRSETTFQTVAATAGVEPVHTVGGQAAQLHRNCAAESEIAQRAVSGSHARRCSV